jgi:SAM-dependent methyltransferase
MNIMVSVGSNLAAAKTRQKRAWSTGDYGVIGSTMQIVGEDLCEALDLRAGSRVLDVAAGNGNASLAAARRGCDVTCTDYVIALLDAARQRAQAECLPMEFHAADAEDLCFEDGSFDVVMSTFGAMFTPDQERAANELLRVCRQGGRIALANWTPDSFVGRVLEAMNRWAPSPQGVPCPALWGEPERIDELFGRGASNIRTRYRVFTFFYRSPQHFIEVLRKSCGPVKKVYGTLDVEQQFAFTQELMSLFVRRNRAEDGTLVLPGKYLEVVIERR